MTSKTGAAPRWPADAKRVRALIGSRLPAHLIDGKWIDGQASRLLAVEDPATGGIIGSVPAGDQAMIDTAVAAARRAFREGPWPKLAPRARAAMIARLADALSRERDFFCQVEALDAGHTLASIRSGDLPLAVERLREAAGWATRIDGYVAMGPATSGAMDYVLREPIGVVGIITPWNAPLLMTVQKVAAALAAGCTAVVKPPELAPFSALYFADLCDEVGIPAGVVNVVTGEGAVAGQALAENGDVNLITFTGSTRTGKAIMAAAAATNLKRVVLELGGKSPVIVLADADLDAAAKEIASEIALKSGQYCAAGTRVLAHGSIFGALLERLTHQLAQVRLGPGYAADVDMGPMISAAQRTRADEIVCEAIGLGAGVPLRGGPQPGAGYFYKPTVLVDATPQMRASREEIFAPVLLASHVPNEAPLERIAAQANHSRYGLSAKIWTKDLRAAHSLSRMLETGQVIINGGGGTAVLPFGGVKQSGYGRENGLEGLAPYLETKAIRLGYR